MNDSVLSQIQTLQFVNKAEAEALALSFIRDVYSPNVAVVELRPLAVSLNSFNGYITLLDGQRYFFKTHTEPNTIIQEYYNTELLARHGYPIIQPIFRSSDVGRQLLIYELIDAPSVFDLSWDFETGNRKNVDSLIKAQHKSDDQLVRIYIKSLEWLAATEAAKAPIHQLFYHRLTGGRLQEFYNSDAAASMMFNCGGRSLPFTQLRQMEWQVNGQVYTESLDDIIHKAQTLLIPQQAGPIVVGHGDAHNGNVFFFEQAQELVYFDPAFAGQHDPLLDLVKPLFHNVFAMWMYFPSEKDTQLRISTAIHRNQIVLEHDYTLLWIRNMFLESKIDRVLIPMLRILIEKQWLRNDWKAYVKAALFCCPFLTMNLLSRDRFPESISLLGLAMAIEMGSESFVTRSLIDQVLDRVSLEIGQ
jgi:hypothetical protein